MAAVLSPAAEAHRAAASTRRREGRRLGELLGTLPAGTLAETSPDAGDAEIRAVTSDSRQVGEGSLFVAIRGARFDGHEFLPAAAAAGAAAAVVERRPPPAALPWARVRDSRRAAGPLAAAFHGRPSERMRLAGITGTNGKTTVAWLLDEILWRVCGSSLLCGTVEHRIRTGAAPLRPGGPGLTSREAADFQALLARALAAGCAAGAVECSSHGLEHGRLGGTAFEVAVFTNLTRDHLDFHPDLDAYYRAKRRLFADLLRCGGAAVVSADDPWGERLLADLADLRPDARLLSFGHGPEATVRLAALRADAAGIRLRLDTPAGVREIRSPLLGDFNAGNLAAAWAAATALGVPGEAAAAALAEAGGPPGRMERIALAGDGPVGEGAADRGPLVLVDYAHTPDALARALAAARCLVGTGRLSVVFGCGGDRDRAKRPLMGDAAARLADRVLLTSDNPRSEDPEAILADIRLGAGNPALGAEVASEPERRLAIERALVSAVPGELVLIAGRGHETHQQVGGARVPLDDRELARAALEARARGRQQPVDKVPRMRIRPPGDGNPGRRGGGGALCPQDGGPNRWRDSFHRFSRGGRALPAPLPGGASRRVPAPWTFSTA